MQRASDCQNWEIQKHPTQIVGGVSERWWSGRGSNPRPSHCERDALPAELPPHTRRRILGECPPNCHAGANRASSAPRALLPGESCTPARELSGHVLVFLLRQRLASTEADRSRGKCVPGAKAPPVLRFARFPQTPTRPRGALPLFYSNHNAEPTLLRAGTCP